jgi:putative transcriptional regulator
MVKTTKTALIKRDRRRDIGREVLQAIQDIKARKIGRIFYVEATQTTKIRLKLGRSGECKQGRLG